MTGEEMERSIEAHDRQLEVVVATLASMSEKIDKLVAVTNQDAENIRALARVAELRERRITHLEG